MKKRIYKIKNKNLVTGNPNEITENEVLVKENNDGTVELSHRNNGTLETLGSGGSGGGNIKYYDVSGIDFSSDSEYDVLIPLPIIGKAVNNDTINIVTNPATLTIDPSVKIIAIAIDLTLELYIGSMGGKIESVENLLKQYGAYDLLLSLPTLTKEQFYDLTLPTE
jgi:hypothetical protein